MVAGRAGLCSIITSGRLLSGGTEDWDLEADVGKMFPCDGLCMKRRSVVCVHAWVALASCRVPDPASGSQLTPLSEVLLVFRDDFCIPFVSFSKLFFLQPVPFTVVADYLVALKVMSLAFKNPIKCRKLIFSFLM